jgi:hypothetical protein
MADLWYPDLLQEAQAFPAHIFFAFYERESTMASSMQDTVHLYMPEQFGQPNTVEWEQYEVGATVNSFAKGAMNGIQQFLTKGMSTKNQERIGKAQGIVSNYGAAAGDLTQLQFGVAPNPYLAQIFRKVNFRSFNYTFKLVPLSEGDCETIQAIIRTFRKWSLPRGPQGGAGAGSAYLHYPGEVDIQYMWMGGPNKYIHRFKRSVITSLDVQYTGSGMWSMMRNGFPAETVLQLNFTEIQIVVRDDVEENY